MIIRIVLAILAIGAFYFAYTKFPAAKADPSPKNMALAVFPAIVGLAFVIAAVS